MKWPDPGRTPENVANRLLGSQEWARVKLAAFHGRTFSLAVGPLSAAWTIDAGGLVTAAGAGAVADVRLTVSPLSVPSLLADPARWNEFVVEAGDPQLGGALKELARTVPWFVEETFAKALGPIIGQRVADAGRKLLAFPEYATQRFGMSAGSYARDEAGLLAHGADLRQLRDDVATVVSRVDALAARIEALAPRVLPIR